MTDYQFRQIITMIYKILEANVAAGKTPQELLEVVAQLADDKPRVQE
ncbi:MAG: hypothetical protein LBL51_04435 [Synergistaceae bacterium]|nr:hypothetical protein [Synergistaceae bacterium]